MKPLAPRSPSRKGRFCWHRQVTDEACTWRLFRRDDAGRVYQITVTYQRRVARQDVAARLRQARRELRDRVDEVDLQAMFATEKAA